MRWWSNEYHSTPRNCSWSSVLDRVFWFGVPFVGIRCVSLQEHIERGWGFTQKFGCQTIVKEHGRNEKSYCQRFGGRGSVALSTWYCGVFEWCGVGLPCKFRLIDCLSNWIKSLLAQSPRFSLCGGSKKYCGGSIGRFTPTARQTPEDDECQFFFLVHCYGPHFIFDPRHPCVVPVKVWREHICHTANF